MTNANWCQRAEKEILDINNVIDGRVSNFGDTDAKDSQKINKICPRDGSLLYRLNAGCSEDMEEAVKSARAAYNDKRWRGLSLHRRKFVLIKLAELVEAHQQTFALYESLDVGKPITQALGEVGQAAEILRETAESAVNLFSLSISDGGYSAHQLRKPVGVVGAITSWNYPLILAVLKIGPALIMGNCLVLKPSELAGLSTGLLGTLALEAGVPAGVLNVVQGCGQVVGATLAHHRDVDLLSFTGSSSTGKLIQLAAGQSNMKRLLLECGGKAPYLVFEDSPKNLDAVAADIVDKSFKNQGANCLAATRLLVHKNIKDKLLPKVIEQAELRIPRDPLESSSNFGALISEAHMNKVLGYIERGQQEGAKLICGGSRAQVDAGSFTANGFYIKPTIFDNVTPQQAIAQEEIFGPVLSVLTFDTEEEAIKLANNTSFGLAAYIATENMGCAQRLSQEINAGFIMITGTSNPIENYREIGKEGHRQSGCGIEGGLSGLASYSLSTAVHTWT